MCCKLVSNAHLEQQQHCSASGTETSYSYCGLALNCAHIHEGFRVTLTCLAHHVTLSTVSTSKNQACSFVVGLHLHSFAKKQKTSERVTFQSSVWVTFPLRVFNCKSPSILGVGLVLPVCLSGCRRRRRREREMCV